MEKVRRRSIPAFGEWNQCEELPITQFFESAMQSGLVIKVSLPPHKPTKKVRTMDEESHGRRKKGGYVADGGAHGPRNPRVVSRAVDEDLYKIPPELLRKKAKGKKNVRNLWMGCVGLNCVA